MKKVFYSLQLSLLGVLLPVVVFAQQQESNPLVPCGGTGQPACTFDHLIVLINNVIKFALFYVAIPIAVAVIVWAGILIMTSAGNESKISQGRQMITGVMTGLLIAFTAWLIVETIVNVLFSP